MNKSKVWTYIKSIAIPLAVGGIVGWITSKSMDMSSLKQPPLVPPSAAFPIVWIILYTLMGVSYGILDTNNLMDSEMKARYYWQLGINALWPIAFFVLEWRLFALLWIILLDVLIIKMIMEFYEKNKTAAYLQIPYIVWSLFATYLNFGLYILNR